MRNRFIDVFFFVNKNWGIFTVRIGGEWRLLASQQRKLYKNIGRTDWCVCVCVCFRFAFCFWYCGGNYKKIFFFIFRLKRVDRINFQRVTKVRVREGKQGVRGGKCGEKGRRHRNERFGIREIVADKGSKQWQRNRDGSSLCVSLLVTRVLKIPGC